MRALIATISILILFQLCLAKFPPWDCPSFKPRPVPPTNVTDLSPVDIKVIMAMGDSMTAGFAMHSDFIINGLVEYRGDVYCIGGNADQVTVPNFLEHINGGVKLVGPSVGVSLPLDAVKFKDHIVQPFDARIARLNAAQSMAKIEDVINMQTDYLVKELTTTYAQQVDFHNDWKMLTINIGANNLCDCSYNSKSTPEAFADQMRQLLNDVHARIPRVFVNLLTVFNISQVYDISKGHPYCEFFHKTFDECPDLSNNDQTRAHMDVFATQYNVLLHQIAAEWQAQNLQNFTVVVQPVTQNMIIEGVEDVSHLDCFHPSALADEGFAVGLWNSFLSPAAKKPTNIDPTIRPICPDASSRLM